LSRIVEGIGDIVAAIGNNGLLIEREIGHND
jgi:hypothetical protein